MKMLWYKAKSCPPPFLPSKLSLMVSCTWSCIPSQGWVNFSMIQQIN